MMPLFGLLPGLGDDLFVNAKFNHETLHFSVALAKSSVLYIFRCWDLTPMHVIKNHTGVNLPLFSKTSLLLPREFTF